MTDIIEALSHGVMHAPGIYMNLPEAEYHADPALGSTGIKDLLGEPSAYWWGSHYNPMREEREESAAMVKGTAVHCAVLYGLDEFRRRYGRCVHKGNVKAGMAERQEMEARGVIPLKASDYDRILVSGTMIRANPSVGAAFSNGAAEVSVFWEEEVDGEIVRRKARFDYLKAKAIVDLKSHAPMDGKTFVTSCHRALKTFNYPVQAAAYMDAIPHMKDFWNKDMIFGASDADKALLHAFVQQEVHAFVFVFWASTGAPLTWGGTFSEANPAIQLAKTQVQVALQTFVDYRREFGTDKAWIRAEPLSEIDPDEIERWYARDSA
jgi:hypothetical protein